VDDASVFSDATQSLNRDPTATHSAAILTETAT
jgi:hypothetical protein